MRFEKLDVNAREVELLIVGNQFIVNISEKSWNDAGYFLVVQHGGHRSIDFATELHLRAEFPCDS